MTSLPGHVDFINIRGTGGESANYVSDPSSTVLEVHLESGELCLDFAPTGQRSVLGHVLQADGRNMSVLICLIRKKCYKILIVSCIFVLKFDL